MLAARPAEARCRREQPRCGRDVAREHVEERSLPGCRLRGRPRAAIGPPRCPARFGARPQACSRCARATAEGTRPGRGAARRPRAPSPRAASRTARCHAPRRSPRGPPRRALPVERSCTPTRRIARRIRWCLHRAPRPPDDVRGSGRRSRIRADDRNRLVRPADRAADALIDRPVRARNHLTTVRASARMSAPRSQASSSCFEALSGP